MSALLKQIRVKGFKAIRDSENVSLRPLILLIGRNGSGKSSLVEALQVLQSAIDVGLQQSLLDRYRTFDDVLNRRISNERISLSLVLQVDRQEVRYELEFGNRGVLRESCRQGRTVSQRETIETVPGYVRSIAKGPPIRDRDRLALAHVRKTGATGAEQLLNFLRSAVFLRLSPEVLSRSESLTRPARLPVLDESGAGVVALLRSLKADQRARAAKKLAQVIPGVESVAVMQDASRGYYATKERMIARGGTRSFDVPAWMLSEGTRRLTALYALLERRPRPSLIVVEEIENGLDPWTLKDVFRELRTAADEGMQVIVTTHSPFLLDHVDLDDILHARREAGETTYQPIANYEPVMRYRGVVMPGAMYASEFFK